jgi:hypothetical protein
VSLLRRTAPGRRLEFLLRCWRPDHRRRGRIPDDSRPGMPEPPYPRNTPDRRSRSPSSPTPDLQLFGGLAHRRAAQRGDPASVGARVRRGPRPFRDLPAHVEAFAASYRWLRGGGRPHVLRGLADDHRMSRRQLFAGDPGGHHAWIAEIVAQSSRGGRGRDARMEAFARAGEPEPRMRRTEARTSPAPDLGGSSRMWSLVADERPRCFRTRDRCRPRSRRHRGRRGA